MQDYVVADDIFWTRTCSDEVRMKYTRRGLLPPQPPPAQPEVFFADAETVAAMAPATEGAQHVRMLRRQATLRIAERGTIRRIARHPGKCVRVCGVVENNSNVVQVGDFDDS